MNYADSARIKAVLLNCGFSYSEKEENADILIFDTCSVRQKSEDKITGALKNIPAHQKIRITGCMVNHNLKKSASKAEFSWTKENRTHATGQQWYINEDFNPLRHTLHQTYPNLELFFRIDDVGKLPLILEKIGYKNLNYPNELVDEYEKIIPNENASMNKHATSAYVPISTWCNQFCAYCIVPYARGRERYFSVENIIAEAKQYLANGAKEITLLGQIVNKHPDFVTIVQEILKLEGLERLRYTSPYPTFYSPELLALHEQEEKLCPHIHIPFQSGSSAVLKKMFRGYSAQDCYTFIDKIRGLKREISITTDMILGFPGETEEDFEKSLQLVEYGRFDMIYMGIYSPRPGTFATKQYPDDIPYKVKHARRNKMNELLKQISRENNQKEIWRTRKVLINEIGADGSLTGYIDNMKQMIIPASSNPAETTILPGTILPIQIVGAGEFKLVGENPNS